MRELREIILHCSATKEGADYTTKDIDAWHRARKFNMIGYHFVIYRNGEIHTGRPLEQAGAHCTNHNAHSIGICYIGGLASDNKTPKDTRTEEQRFSLFKLVCHLCDKYKIPDTNIKAHYEYANKACPSFNINQFRNELSDFRKNYPLDFNQIKYFKDF